MDCPVCEGPSKNVQEEADHLYCENCGKRFTMEEGTEGIAPSAHLLPDPESAGVAPENTDDGEGSAALRATMAVSSNE